MNIKIFFFLLLLVVAASDLLAQVPSNNQFILPGERVERDIAGGESHGYQIRLTVGQFMRVVAEQKAIDVKLILADSDGKPVVEVNFSNVGGLESLSAEATASGNYRLTITAIGSATLKGSYSVQLEEKQASTAQDRQRIDAERLMLEASDLRNQEGKTAQQVTAQAIVKQQQALALWRELGDRYWAALTLSNLGKDQNTVRNFEQAIAYHEEALAITRELNNRAEEGRTLSNLCFVYHGLTRYERAVDYCEQAAAIAREVNNPEGEGTALNNLANAWYSLGRYEKAIENYEQVLAIMREVKNRRAEGVSLSNLANAYFGLNRYETAISYYEQTLLIVRELKNRAAEGRTIFRIGSLYSELSRHEKAIDYKERGLAIARELKDRVEEGIELESLGLSYYNLGRYQQALDYYEPALLISREVKSRKAEGRALAGIGKTLIKLDRNEKAIEYLEQSLFINLEVNDRRNEGSTLYGLGDANLSLNRYDQAIENFEQANLIAHGLKNRLGEALALFGLSRAKRAQGKIAAAQAHIEESLKISESMRSEVLSPESRFSLLANIQVYYQLYTDLLMSQHKAEPTKGFDALALEVSERKRARSLLDLLAESKTDLRQGIAPALVEREQTVAKQLNDKAQVSVQANKPEQAAELKREISQLENDLERAQSAIRKANPNYAALVQPQPLTFKKIQAELDADTLLLQYALGEERSYLWAITKDSLTSYELPKEALIKQSSLQVYEMLTARNTRKSDETAIQRKVRITEAEAKLPAAAHALSKMLLAPAAAQLGGKRLVIVADGALQYIPFAMLPDPAARNQPLIVGHEVVSLPSASALAIQRTELAGRPLAPKMLAVIADPVFDRTDTRFKTTAAETSGIVQAASSADTRGLEHIAEASGDKTGRLIIRRLPFTRQEADGLLALTPKDSSFRAMDFSASRANVINGDLSQYRYVHFATHGLLDTERPGLSSLVLSTIDADGKPQDGFLRANDIYNMKLPAELVVLSACQTGLGKEVKGEGLIGLTRGFMYAGAKRVVVSLWSVNDKATSDLMTKFYRGMLKESERPAAALRAAQIAMWKQKQWQSPYYWAAFTMQGEWK